MIGLTKSARSLWMSKVSGKSLKSLLCSELPSLGFSSIFLPNIPLLPMKLLFKLDALFVEYFETSIAVMEGRFRLVVLFSGGLELLIVVCREEVSESLPCKL